MCRRRKDFYWVSRQSKKHGYDSNHRQIFSNNSFIQQHGVFYVAGRDSHYRPILVFDVEKIIKLEMSEEDLLATQTYFF